MSQPVRDLEGRISLVGVATQGEYGKMEERHRTFHVGLFSAVV